MIRFVDEDKMSPVQRALEHARFQLCLLDGVQVSHSDGSSYVVNVKETITLIDEALASVATASEPNTAP